MSDRARNVFLTGASSGIGLATATLLCRHGYRVWGTARDAAHLPALAGLQPLAIDLADIDSIEPCYLGAQAQAGGFDVLINNAGFASFAPLLDLPIAALEREWRVMVAAPLRLAQLAAASLAERDGVIVNVSSLAAEYPIPCMGGYSAAKAASASLSATLRHEFAALEAAGAGRGPRVIDLQPGDIDTGFNAHMHDPPVAAARRRWASSIRAACERHCTSAPDPQHVARDVLRAIEQRPSSPLRSGHWLQVQVGPRALALLPLQLREWVLRRYYRR